MAIVQPLIASEVRKVAHLARLDLSDAQIDQYATQLGAVIGYMDRLRQLDLDGVEPMTSPLESTNRLAADVPGPMLSNERLMSFAPQSGAHPPFIAVPRVIGGREGA